VPVLTAVYTPVSPSAALPPNADIGELTLSQSIRVDGTPVDPGSEFEAGQPVLYVSFDFSGMIDGVLWRHVWWRDGALYGGETRVWEWKTVGRSYFRLLPADGFEPGDYRVEMMLEDEVVRSATFVVNP
jgi:hypothetical protein